MGKINQYIRKTAIFILKSYQTTLSLILPSVCRFYPSCSNYSIAAILRFGIIKGFFLTSKRLLRCHPWCEGGYDPVPNKKV